MDEGELPAPLLQRATIHVLAEHWQCTPSQARAEDYEDAEFALVLLEARAGVEERRRRERERELLRQQAQQAGQRR